MKNSIPILTSDGSHTINSSEYNVTYHSIHGAITESEHVFIEAGLGYYNLHYPATEINIFEMGMGTGLNVLLTILNQLPFIKINFTTIESSPLNEAQITALNYVNQLSIVDKFATKDISVLFDKIHQAEWNQTTPITSTFSLTKIKGDIRIHDLNNCHFDIIFYDAFGPGTQAYLWEYDILSKISDSLNKNGVFVTYCAMGQFKRDLKSLGLEVQSIPGPPGKREMVRAIKT